MKDPNKKQFILDSIEKIRELKERIIECRKKNEDTSGLLKEVQSQVAKIKDRADEVFDSGEEVIAPEELDVFLQSPSNFSQEDWELLNTIKEETAACKKEIIKASDGEAAKDLIGRKKKKKSSKPKKV